MWKAPKMPFLLYRILLGNLLLLFIYLNCGNFGWDQICVIKWFSYRLFNKIDQIRYIWIEVGEFIVEFRSRKRNGYYSASAFISFEFEHFFRSFISYESLTSNWRCFFLLFAFSFHCGRGKRCGTVAKPCRRQYNSDDKKLRRNKIMNIDLAGRR